MVPGEVIMSKIYLIRGRKVILDMDLAELYGVETKQLKRAVRRNISRFPSDFMFELTPEELANWRSQFGTSNREKMGLRYPPFTFSEHGVLMLASVLSSERAVQVNIQIVRIFTKLREMLLAHKDIIKKLSQIEQTLSSHDGKILLIFEYLKQLEQDRQQQLEQKERKRIGFKRDSEAWYSNKMMLTSFLNILRLSPPVLK
ncbi:MAG: ORF6N domain-containing protein [Bacteroidales bacterium]|nr:ORF6N domain-containing protein [Bacteroidales bacterium]